MTIELIKGRIEDGAVGELMKDEKADLIWCDPPWGGGFLKWFETHKFKKTGEPKNEHTDWGQFCLALGVACVEFAKGPILIKIGQKQTPDIIEAFNSVGLTLIDQVEELYDAGKKELKPCDLLLFWNGMTPSPQDIQSNWHLHGEEACEQSILKFASKGDLILDPCVGLGIAARVAKKHSMDFRGVDINQFRLNKTLERWQKP